MLTLLRPRGIHPAASTVDQVVCVDLDGTLVIGDLLWEAFVGLLKRSPWRALRTLFALRRGKAQFKREVARLMPLDPVTLSYRETLVAELRAFRDDGRPVVLATAADESYARAVARHLDLFTEVLASDGATNLSGPTKARALVERYGEKGFAYVGNSRSDVPVWRAAAAGHAVAAPRAVVRHAEAHQLVQRVTDEPVPRWRALARAMRPYQWVKNLLVFVPILASHNVLRADLWMASGVAFIVFSLCASAIYLVNDISDIDADRRHVRKRRRPFAAGHLSIATGAVTAVLLLLPALGLAWAAVSWQLALVALAYVAVTAAYSFDLKRRPVFDVFTLTGLYVHRIIAGSVATGIPLSSWLLAFALFFFLSLAFVKRYSEVIAAEGWLPGRGYCEQDGPWIQAIGTAAGYMAVLVLVLYINAPDVTALYSQPKALWALCPLLLFWVTRLWFRASRRVMSDDPVLEAMKDRVSYMAAGAALIIMLLAI